jgi:hypothetical protein
MHIPSQDTFGAEPVHNKEPKEDFVFWLKEAFPKPFDSQTCLGPDKRA